MVSFHTNSNGAFAQRRIVLCGLKGTAEGIKQEGTKICIFYNVKGFSNFFIYRVLRPHAANLITGKIHYKTIANRYQNEKLKVGAAGIHGGGDKVIMHGYWSLKLNPSCRLSSKILRIQWTKKLCQKLLDWKAY